MRHKASVLKYNDYSGTIGHVVVNCSRKGIDLIENFEKYTANFHTFPILTV